MLPSPELLIQYLDNKTLALPVVNLILRNFGQVQDNLHRDAKLEAVSKEGLIHSLPNLSMFGMVPSAGSQLGELDRCPVHKLAFLQRFLHIGGYKVLPFPVRKRL